jgi:regulation of enolase protein 1 (concanavalin A-like superfamily)
MQTNPWSTSIWINEPDQWRVDGTTLVVETGFETDFWRHTAYGFIHDSGHALVDDFPTNTSLELDVKADYSDDFDQAGIMVWADHEHWVKCGLEFADGVLGLGAVVTNEVSDWSTAPVPGWAGAKVSLRVSRAHDGLTIRARAIDSEWHLVRLAPLDPGLVWKVGAHAASPSRGGLQASFSDRRVGSADESLH